MNKALRINSP